MCSVNISTVGIDINEWIYDKSKHKPLLSANQTIVDLQQQACYLYQIDYLAACYLRAVRATNGRKRDHIALSAGHGVRRGQLEDRLQCQTTGEDHLRNGSADEGARVQGSGATGTEGAAHVPGAGRVRVVCGQAAAAARPESGVDYSELSEGDSAGC